MFVSNFLLQNIMNMTDIKVKLNLTTMQILTINFRGIFDRFNLWKLTISWKSLDADESAIKLL